MTDNGSKPNYDAMSDEALAALAKNGDGEAERVLIERFMPAVKRKAREFFILGGDNADLVQEGSIGLYNAMRDFNCERGARFRGYAEVCIANRIKAAIAHASRNKHIPLNTSLSLDMPLGDEGDASETLVDRLEAAASESPDEVLIWRERERTLVSGIREKLTEFEKRVLSLYLDGNSYRQIALKTARTVKAVDNAIQRIKKKVRSIVETEDA
ncbi:MAG: sigma-70 family RNA polymerase sigma factor [Clostridia bacterium]|nr:sigma-70 family RNA polymerase sigma factor [Clostridia bacterium]